VKAPKFLNSLQEENRYLLNIGGVGKQVYYILRIKSYDWLHYETPRDKPRGVSLS
jgi:hypothetical protein|tara:strand:+ start:350 stop:514 length:165 start_codon:yes stop_codon:yes gene_type:complete